jgi:hypothetical protein
LPPPLDDNDNVDEANGLYWSKVQFTAIAGHTYYIGVGTAGYIDSYEGAFRLNLNGGGPTLPTRPPNDNIANAYVLGPLNTSGNVFGTTVNATQQDGEPKPRDTTIGSAGTVWYRYEPRGVGGGNITVTLDGNYDTVLAVYRGYNGSITSLIPIAVNDDISSTNTDSRLTWAARNDTNYYIQVSGYNGASGPYGMYLTRQPFSQDTVAPAGRFKSPPTDYTNTPRTMKPWVEYSEDVGHAGRSFVYLWRWNGSSWIQEGASKQYRDYKNRVTLVPNTGTSPALRANTWYNVRFSVYDAHGNNTVTQWKFKTGA